MTISDHPRPAAVAGSGFTRRDFLRRTALAGLALPAVATASACGDDSNAAGSGKLRVAYYQWIENVAPWLSQLKTRFEKDNPGVEVEYSPLANDLTNADSLVQKFTLEARQNKATYDLILGPTPWVEVGSLAKSGAVLALDDIIPARAKERLVERARREAVAPDGKTYSVPFWTDVVGFLTRPDLLRQHDTPAPTTWSDLAATVDALRPGLPEGMFVYGADWSFLHRLFLPILVTLTDTPFADNGTVDIGSPEAHEALELLGRLQPAMPPSAAQDLGSAEVFQAGKLLMETYWQAQYQRSQEGGLTEDQVTFAENLTGDHAGTVFWNTSGVVLKNSPVPELAVKFMTDGLLGEFGMTQSVTESGRACPVTDLTDIVELPLWLSNAYTQLESGTALPCNDAFLSVEQPAFEKEVQRMIIEGRSAGDTQQALVGAFAEYQW